MVALFIVRKASVKVEVDIGEVVTQGDHDRFLLDKGIEDFPVVVDRQPAEARADRGMVAGVSIPWSGCRGVAFRKVEHSGLEPSEKSVYLKNRTWVARGIGVHPGAIRDCEVREVVDCRPYLGLFHLTTVLHSKCETGETDCSHTHKLSIEGNTVSKTHQS
jgi:hypothetical protein